MFFWQLVGGINQINWIVCTTHQPAMNQISPFLLRAFLGYLLQPVSLYISFHPHHLCKSRWSKNYFISVSFTRSQMDFHWAGYNRSHLAVMSIKYIWHDRVPEDSDAGSIELSPVLKRHNAYMVHNETIYCQEVNFHFQNLKEWMFEALNFRMMNGGGTTAVSRWKSVKYKFK